MRTTFKELFGELTAWGRFWLYLGLCTLIWAALMSYSFGAEISFKHAMFLMCLSAVAAFLPDAARHMWDEGRKVMGVVLGIIAIPTLAIEFYTHAGYTAGLRGSNIETAQVQNSKYDGAQDTAKENKALLESFKRQLADFKSKNGDWVTTVSADALRAQLESANLAIKLEAAKKGCKDKCLARTKERDEIAAKIATIEEGNKIAAQVTAQQALVDSKRDVAAKVEHKSSAVDHQNKFLAKSVALFSDGSLKPSEIMTEGAQQTVNLAMALAGTGLPALALFVAGLYRRPSRKDTETEQHGITSASPLLPGGESVSPLMPAARPDMAPVINNITHRVEDLKARDAVARIASRVVGATAQYRLAA